MAMNASKKRESEYWKMRSAFESLDWPVPHPAVLLPLHGADAGALLPSPDQYLGCRSPM